MQLVKTLTDDQILELRKAQLKAVDMEYGPWTSWMRREYAFSLAVKFAKYMGFKMPCHGFYVAMRQAPINMTDALARTA